MQLLFNRKNTKEIETLKANFELNKKYNEEILKTYLGTQFEDQKEEIRFIKKYNNVVQLTKETIRDVITHTSIYAINTTTSEFEEKMNEIRKLYSEAFTDLSKKTRDIAHPLKNHIESTIKLTISFLSVTDESKKHAIISAIDEISNFQSILIIRKEYLSNQLISNLKDFIKDKSYGQ